MTDGTPNAPLGESPAVNTKMKLTQTEALLAVLVEHLEDQVRTLKFGLSAVLHDLGAEVRPENPIHNAWKMLHPDTTVVNGVEIRQSTLPPFPPHWLGTMARTGRSLAQVSGKFDATERVTQALARVR